MFVPITCSECGKPFQVPEAAVGTRTLCPWCQASVLALPLGGAARPAPPAPNQNSGLMPTARQQTPEPLPLDDDEPPPRPRRGFKVPVLVIVVLAVFAAVVATVTTMGFLRQKQGYMTAVEWRTFTAPDNSCAVDLLGTAVEDADEPPADGKRYVSAGWYSGTTTWVGWRDLTAHQAEVVVAKDGWVQLVPTFSAEMRRLKSKFGGTVTKDATKFDDTISHEFRLEYPQGRVVAWAVVKPGGPRPRVYFVGIAGKNLDPDGPEVARLRESFRVFD